MPIEKSMSFTFTGPAYDRINRLANQYKLTPKATVGLLVAIGDYYLRNSQDIVDDIISQLRDFKSC